MNPPNVDNATGHSAAFSWDGETISFGHEPGGGLQARCKANGEPVTNGILGPGVQTSEMKSFFFYEADITRGLFTWRLDDRDTERAYRLRHLNPQTQEFTIGAKKDHDRWNENDKWHDDRD